MPEIPTSKAGFLLEGLNYLLRYPLIELTWRTGKAYTKPISAGIMLTTRCNLNCSTCFVDKTSDYEDMLSEKELYDLIDFLADWGVRQLTFTGGEPLLYKNFFQVLKHCSQKGITTGFSTNGTLIDEEAVDKLYESGAARVTVSIDGPEKAHDYIRGKGAYRKVLKALKLLRENKKRKGRPDVRINTVLTSENVGHLDEMFDLAKEHGASLNLMPFSIEDVVPTKERKIYKKTVEKLWIKDIEKLSQVLKRMKMRKRREGVLFNQDTFLDLLVDYYKNPKYVERQCKKGAYAMSFLGNGDVSFCGVVGILGNVRENDPKEIWESEEFEKARRIMKGCKRCLLNCNYTPPLKDLFKDFLIYPLLRKLRWLSV